MFRRPVKEINAEFSAEDKYLDSIQRTVRESCIAAGMASKDTSAVLLAIEEGATNIIRHAYLYEKGVIRLRIVIYRRLIVFSLIDFGRSFQPAQQDQFDLEKLVDSGRKGGLGFYMIQKIMDSVEYITSSSFNELRMIKRIGRSRESGRPMLHRLFTLRVKFSFWTFFIVSIILGGSYYYIHTQTMAQARIHLDKTVTSLAATIADQAAGYYINRRSDVEYDELVVSYIRSNAELLQVVLTDPAGLIRAHSQDIRLIGEPFQAPGQIDVEVVGAPQALSESDASLNYLIVPVQAGERQIGKVHVTFTSQYLWEEMKAARTRIIFLTIGLLSFGIFGIYLLSNYFVRPIVDITRRVRRFTKGDLESELSLDGAEEFFEISRAFNEMMVRVSQDKKNTIAREKLAREIEVASHIQKALLPYDIPEVPGLSIDAYYRAASVIGGDLYDIFPIGGERYCLVVADVSGKGVPGSLVMSMVRTVIQIHAGEETSSATVLSKVNNYLEENIPRGMFVTLMLVIYDATGRKMNIVSAGHNPMIYYCAGRGKFDRINPAGLPVGVPITDGSSFEDHLDEVSIDIDENDLFLVYTDGISEAVDRDRNQFGVDRMEELLGSFLKKEPEASAQTLSSELVRQLDDFVGFGPPDDDITFVLARAVPKAVPAADSETGNSKTRVAVKKIKDGEKGKSK